MTSPTSSWRVSLLLLLPALAACKAKGPPQGSATAQGPAVLSVIAGETVAPPGSAPKRGTLVVGWLDPAEEEARAAGRMDLRMIRRLVERLRLAGEVDFGLTPRVPYRIEAPADAVPLAVLDVD